MRIYLFIMVFLLIGAFFIISNDNLHINKSAEVGKFFKSYYVWFGGLFENVKGISGYVVKSEWLPDSEPVVGNSSKG